MSQGYLGNVSDQGASREFMQFLQGQFDKPLGLIVLTADAVSPPVKKHGVILWQSTALGKTFLVHYDGTHKYFWECDGVDLY
jgi:hypothetical protein